MSQKVKKQVFYVQKHEHLSSFLLRYRWYLRKIEYLSLNIVQRDLLIDSMIH